MHRPSYSRTPKEIRGALVGTLLGDSFISKGRTFCCEQKSLNLVKLKAELISHYTRNYPKITYREPRDSFIGGKVIRGSGTFTVQGDHDTFKKWSKIFYMFGERQIRMSLLRQLSDEGLALWIMDDGFMYYTKSNSTRRLILCTDAYSELSHKLMVNYFQEYYSVSPKIIKHKSRKDAKEKLRLAFNATDTQKIISIVYPYVLDEYLYKIDMHYSDKSLNSQRCSDAYKEAYECISQRMAASTN